LNTSPFGQIPTPANGGFFGSQLQLGSILVFSATRCVVFAFRSASKRCRENFKNEKGPRLAGFEWWAL
jgi:hypothetical protein